MINLLHVHGILIKLILSLTFRSGSLAWNWSVRVIGLIWHKRSNLVYSEWILTMIFEQVRQRIFFPCGILGNKANVHVVILEATIGEALQEKNKENKAVMEKVWSRVIRMYVKMNTAVHEAIFYLTSQLCNPATLFFVCFLLNNLGWVSLTQNPRPQSHYRGHGEGHQGEISCINHS